MTFATAQNQSTIQSFQPKELVFLSQANNDIYRASQIPSMPDELIADLISETSSILSSLAGVKEDAEWRAEQGHVVDFDWLKRVRIKYSKVSSFKKLLSHQAEIRLGLCGSRKAVQAVKREKASIDAHNEHQKQLKQYEFAKRKFFYGLVQEEIGKALFNELMTRASAMAESVAPSPKTRK